MTAVLHTWEKNLSQHCLVPGRALSGDEWRPAKGHYLFPVRALSHHFRGAMVSAIRKTYQQNKLHRITDSQQVDEKLDGLMKKAWVVYTRPYLTEADTVVKYLSQYSHKIAISNHRLQRVTDEQVTFGWKDYRAAGQRKIMSLNGAEFIRRFLLHILPKGLMRIRHYGFLSNRCRKEKLAKIRRYIAQSKEAALNHGTEQTTAKPITIPNCPCPKCKAGILQVIAEIPAIRALRGERRQYVN
ncbi:MAG: transposase [Gammaproteobacteria bacterium]|nr:transposase [Gammaproteobacteria bacterium]